MSDTAAAMKDINAAIRLKKSAELFVNRGVIHQFMADNVNAMRDYQAAVLIDPNFGLAYYNSANILLFHRQFEQAVKQLDMAIDKCGMRDECTLQNRAIAKALCNDSSGAYRDFSEALKHCKYSSHIYMNRGLLLYKMECYDQAEKDFTAGKARHAAEQTEQMKSNISCHSKSSILFNFFLSFFLSSHQPDTERRSALQATRRLPRQAGDEG